MNRASAACAGPLSHTQKATDLQDVLEQGPGVKTVRQKGGLIALIPLRECGTIVPCAKWHSSNICKLGRKGGHVRLIKQMDSLFLQMGTVLLAG